MNFFLFNPTSKQLEISPDFWIFIATWLPLTFITAALYVFILYIDSKLKQKKFRWPWQVKAKKPRALPATADVSIAEKIG